MGRVVGQAAGFLCLPAAWIHFTSPPEDLCFTPSSAVNSEKANSFLSLEALGACGRRGVPIKDTCSFQCRAGKDLTGAGTQSLGAGGPIQMQTGQLPGSLHALGVALAKLAQLYLLLL